MAGAHPPSVGSPESRLAGRCPRCGADPVPLTVEGLCGLCETDRKVLRTIAEWCRSREACEALEIGPDAIAAAFEYELFACALRQIGPSVREGEA